MQMSFVKLKSFYKNWGIASHELRLEFPCDWFWEFYSDILFRGVTIHAEPEIIFQWLWGSRYFRGYNYQLSDFPAKT